MALAAERHSQLGGRTSTVLRCTTSKSLRVGVKALCARRGHNPVIAIVRAALPVFGLNQ